jgi:hypothetical protein
LSKSFLIKFLFREDYSLGELVPHEERPELFRQIRQTLPPSTTCPRETHVPPTNILSPLYFAMYICRKEINAECSDGSIVSLKIFLQ